MKVWFIGAGPGDPELITVKGARIIGEAAVIIYAGSLVPKRILGYARDTAEIHDSAGMALDEVCAVYKKYAGQDITIARVHTGDPSLYGAIGEQIAFLRREGIPFEVVPGVSSFQASAAVLEQELTLPGVSQTVIITRIAGRTPTPEKEDLALLAKAQATMVLFLSVGRSKEVEERLLTEYPPQTPFAIVYRAGWPEQRVFRGVLSDLHTTVRENSLTRQSLIVVGKVLDNEFELSKLYDAHFTHGYREGKV